MILSFRSRKPPSKLNNFVDIKGKGHMYQKNDQRQEEVARVLENKKKRINQSLKIVLDMNDELFKLFIFKGREGG